MNSNYPDLSWLENPQVYEVNRIPAHSDHYFYESKSAMEQEYYQKDGPCHHEMGLRQSLNGYMVLI